MKNDLTAEQVEILENYIIVLQDKLDLQYWRVYVGADAASDEHNATIEPTEGRRYAIISFKLGWWESQDAEEKRITLVHELLHLAHHDQTEVMRSFGKDNGDMGTYVWSVVWEQFRLATERMVDSLSYVIAPHMPEFPG